MNMFHQIKAYSKFLLRSTNQHGVHSPFVYDLVTKCFYDKTQHANYEKLNAYRSRLKAMDKRLIVTDFGAGSRTTKSSYRKISDIAQHAGITPKNSKLLYRFSNYYNPKTVLELGASLGLATQALCLGSPDSKIITIEGCPEIAKFTIEYLKERQLSNFNLINGKFSDVIPKLDIPKFDLVFFDGNHQKEATLNYFEALLPKTHNDTIFIFDDIYWSLGMTEAWETIKQHPKVTVTIDTFYWGIVFFRKEQAKEHFSIRV